MCNLINTHTHTHKQPLRQNPVPVHARRTEGVTGSEGTGMRVETLTRGRTQDGNGDGNESSSGDGNEDGIGEGGREAKKRKKPHTSCRRDVGNGGNFAGNMKICRQERVGSVAANPNNRENSKEGGGEAQDTSDLVRNVRVERVYPLCRV